MNKEFIVRRLYNELASLLSVAMKFNELARLFFELGIIDNPEKPYGQYTGTKADYVLEKLLAAQHKKNFPQALADILFEVGHVQSLINTSSLEHYMKTLGYIYDNPEVPEMTAPKSLPIISVKPDTKLPARVSIEELPENLNELIKELNDNIGLGNVNACALLIRKIITMSVFVRMSKENKTELFKKPNGDDKELNECLSIVQQQIRLPNQVMARVRTAKWIGDSANHSYKVKINAADVETAATGLRLFLEELFK
jgi:hypothetical protein